jgi:hypothetical protein
MFGNLETEKIRKTRKGSKNAQDRREARASTRRRKAERSFKKAQRA